MNGIIRYTVLSRCYDLLFRSLGGSNLQQIGKVSQFGLPAHPVKLARERGRIARDLNLAFHSSLQHVDADTIGS